MWYYLVVFFYVATESSGDFSPNYFCADMGPQPHVIISQLMGIWYGVEVINHIEERHYKLYSSSCPIIHISDEHPRTTISPLYKNYNHSYGYGTGHGYGTPVPQHVRYPQDIKREYGNPSQYDRETTYSNYPTSKRFTTGWRKPYPETKYLRLHWDESGGESVEYHLRYNVSRAGFWISSGPEVGMSLDTRFSHFAGIVQVLKAVGSHLVLTFCHRVPKDQLYTVILAREVKLEPGEVHSVHSLLHRKGLTTQAIKKVCNNSGNKINNVNLSLMAILSLICKLIGLIFVVDSQVF